MPALPPYLLNPLHFTEAELTLLARTADALSAWLGKPVLAEVMDASETGYEYVLYAVPLLPGQEPGDGTTVQIGGTGARLLGGRGGLPEESDTIYLCEYLWGIQLTSLQGVRFIKVDATGEEVAWSEDLNEILPFDLREPPEGGDSDTNSDDNPMQ